MDRNISHAEETDTEKPTQLKVVTKDDASHATMDYVNPHAIDKQSQAVVARTTIDSLKNLPVKSADFQEEIEKIKTFGAADFKRSSSLNSEILERSTTSYAASKQESKSRKKNGLSSNGAQEDVAKTLLNLRSEVSKLNPSLAEKGLFKKIISRLPGSNKGQEIMKRYDSAKDNLDDIVLSLEDGQDNLRRDNASIKQEQTNAVQTVQALYTNKLQLEGIRGAAEDEYERILNEGDQRSAESFRASVIETVARRMLDTETQIAVTIQSAMSLEIIQQNNDALISGVERIKETTLPALRNAVITSVALDNQERVLTSNEKVKRVTEELMVQNASRIRTQGVDINRRASESTIDQNVLSQTYAHLIGAVDDIQEFRNNSVQVLDQNRANLEKAIAETKGQMAHSLNGTMKELGEVE